MITSISGLGERLLSALLRQDRASAGCAPQCETNYWCDPYHHRYSEYCCYNGACVYECGPLMYVDDHCP